MKRYIFRHERFGTMCYDNVNHHLFLNKNLNEFPSEDVRIINNSFFTETALTFPITIFLLTTQKCNLRCLHCLNHSSKENSMIPIIELDTEYIMPAIDEIFDHGGFVIKITGGEPFLRPDIFDILHYIDSKPINTIIFSNGLLIDDNVVNKLKQLKHSRVRISIDGVENTNDKIRGKGSFNAAYNALKKLLLCGVNCEISYTVTSINYLEIEALSNILKNNKLNCKIYLNLIKIVGNTLNHNDLIIPKEMTEHVFNEVKRQINNDIQISYNPFTDLYLKVFGDFYKCPAGRMSLSIGSNGDVFACGLFSGDRSLLCGNIMETNLRTLWKSDPMNFIRSLPERKECAQCCVYGNNCTGGCRGNALNKFGDLCGEDINCDIYNLNSVNFGVGKTLFAFDCL